MTNILVAKDIRVVKCICGNMFFWIFTKLFVLTNNDIVETVECKDCEKRFCRKI